MEIGSTELQRSGCSELYSWILSITNIASESDAVLNGAFAALSPSTLLVQPVQPRVELIPIGGHEAVRRVMGVKKNTYYIRCIAHRRAGMLNCEIGDRG